MSLRLRTPRSLVWLTLCGFLSSTGLPLYESHGLGAADDAACVRTVGQKADASTLSALASADQPTHCAVCHLLRAVNGSIAPAIVALNVPAPTQANAVSLADVPRATDYSAHVSRGPPTTV